MPFLRAGLIKKRAEPESEEQEERIILPQIVVVPEPESVVEEAGEEDAVESLLDEVGECVAVESDIDETGEEAAIESAVDEIGEEAAIESAVDEVGECVAVESDIDGSSEDVVIESAVDGAGEEAAIEASIDGASEDVVIESAVDEIGEEAAIESAVDEVGECVAVESDIDGSGEDVVIESDIDGASEDVVIESDIDGAGEEAAIEASIDEVSEDVESEIRIDAPDVHEAHEDQEADELPPEIREAITDTQDQGSETEPEPEPLPSSSHKDYSGDTLNYDFTSGERYVDSVSTKTEFDKMLDELANISKDLLSHEVEKFAVKFTSKFQGDNDKAEADAKKYAAFLGGYITNAAMTLYDNGYRDAAIKQLDQTKSILEARKKLEEETQAIKTRVEEDEDTVDLTDILGLFGD